jgi:hypothetical protein
MADEIILRDENHVTVGAGIGNDVDQDILMLRVDPVTGYLLCNITDTGATSATESQIASRDQNHRTVCMAWNEQDQELQEVLTDVDGNLLADVDFT